MAGENKSNAMLPLIIVGALLFGGGVFQSMRHKEPETNRGFEASPAVTLPTTASPAVSQPANPRTMQAPDAPPMGKDAAQVAAEADETTLPPSTGETKGVKIEISNAPWLQGIMTGAFGNFREGVLGNLKSEQAKGGINCTPVLTNMTATALLRIEEVSCTAKDGGQIRGDFDEAGDGDLKVEYPNGGMIKISKNDGDFNVETRNSR